MRGDFEGKKIHARGEKNTFQGPFPSLIFVYMVYKSDLRFWFLEVPCLKVRKRPLKLATRLANGSQDDAPKMASVFRKIPKRKIFIFFSLEGHMAGVNRGL